MVSMVLNRSSVRRVSPWKEARPFLAECTGEALMLSKPLVLAYKALCVSY